MACVAVLGVSLGGYRYMSGSNGATTTQRAVEVSLEDEGTRESSISEVIELAENALEEMSASLDDYTARFVKQEADANGVLGEEGEILVKVQTRFRNESNDSPMRIYLNFKRPDNVNGREVIWGDDIYNGRMQVKEAGIMGMMTLSLDPHGVVAMAGQRYPIMELGLKRLTEQLIERGKKDLNNPDVKVTITKDQRVGDLPVDLIQVRRLKPNGADDDFSLAEVAFDPERMLIVRFRSFGWSQDGGPEAPLIESYTYHDIKTNVGLTDTDFSTDNPEYSFP